MAHPQAGPQQYSDDFHPTTDSRRSSTSDVFSDTHALSPSEAPAAPSSADDGDLLAAALRESSPARRSLSLHPSIQSRWNSLRRSGSLHRVAKRGSVSSRRDGSVTASTYLSGASSDHETVSLSSMPRRMTSNASSIIIPRTVSPYHGAAGPSHPYAMYNQDIGVGRTPSNATSSTARTPLRSYTGPSGPSHPYGMYAQNTVSEDDVTAGAGINPALPLGFTGSGHRYQRRLGPEGEDTDDIIGPDGHTEQLPPYTRWPNDVPPEGDSTEPIGNPSDPFVDPQSAQNTSPIEYVNTTTTVPGHASTPMNPAPEVPRSADGGHYKEVPPARSKRRKCGIVPLWVLVVAISILIAVVVGSIVGAAVHHHHSSHKQQEPQAQVANPAAASVSMVTATTSLMDAKPLMSTPSNLPPAPTGSFLLSMWNSSNSKGDCLSSDTNQGNAWACAKGLTINIQLSPSPAGHPQAQILLESPPNPSIRYGPQPPNMSRPANLRLVADQDGPDRGPAYFFQQLYDKIVVIRESEFTNAKSKRWHNHILGGHEVDELEERHWFQENVVSPADHPWFCFWNNTAIEGFIYIDEGTNGAASAQSTPATASSSALYGDFASLETSLPKGPWLGSAASQVTPAPVPSPTMRKRQDTGTPFPIVFKLEELRGPRRKPAYCQQMDISGNNPPSPLPGQYVLLEEAEPSKRARVFRSGSRSTPRRRRNDGPFKKNVVRDDDEDDDDSLVSSCGCEWLNQ